MLKRKISKDIIKFNSLSNGTRFFSIGNESFFLKKLSLHQFKKELNGYRVVRRYYPVPSLVCVEKNNKNGIMIFEFEKSISNNKGLLVDLFAQKNKFDNSFLPILRLYRKVFLQTLKKTKNKSSNVFFEDRISTRLKKFYNKKFIDSFQNKTVILNGRLININLKNTIDSIDAYFKKQRAEWCVVSQCDPNDLNICVKPVIFDYLAGGLNPLMAEFATLFWHNVGQGNYLSPKYNKKYFLDHQAILKKLDKLEFRGNSLRHRSFIVRQDFLKAYVDLVIMPCMNKIGSFDSWYEDFKNYLAMKILAVFDVSRMEKKDIIFSLAYLEYFYNNINPKSPKDLINQIITLWKK